METSATTYKRMSRLILDGATLRFDKCGVQWKGRMEYRRVAWKRLQRALVMPRPSFAPLGT